MSGLPQIKRKELGDAAMNPRMARDYDFFVQVSTGILEAEGFVLFDKTSGYYDIFDGKKFTQTLWGETPFISEQMMPPSDQNGRLRYSLAQRFTRRNERYGVVAEARFRTLEDYTRRTDFRPLFRSLVGDLGVHTRRIIPSADLKIVRQEGCHPFEIVLELGFVIQKPTRNGDMYMFGLQPIQDLARMVSERRI